MTQEPPPALAALRPRQRRSSRRTPASTRRSRSWSCRPRRPQEVVAVLSGKAPRNPVNPEVLQSKQCKRRYCDDRRTGRLARRPMRAWSAAPTSWCRRRGAAARRRPGARARDAQRHLRHRLQDLQRRDSGRATRASWATRWRARSSTAGASALRTGDRVIVDPELYCGTCFHCRIGQTHLCPNGMLLGRDTNGGFAEYRHRAGEPGLPAAGLDRDARRRR